MSDSQAENEQLNGEPRNVNTTLMTILESTPRCQSTPAQLNQAWGRLGL